MMQMYLQSDDDSKEAKQIFDLFGWQNRLNAIAGDAKQQEKLKMSMAIAVSKAQMTRIDTNWMAQGKC